MIMALEEEGHIVGCHQLMQGNIPSRTIGREAPGPIGILASPLVAASFLDAPAPCAQHMMGEHKFVFGGALLERRLKPLVLNIAMSDIP